MKEFNLKILQTNVQTQRTKIISIIQPQFFGYFHDATHVDYYRSNNYGVPIQFQGEISNLNDFWQTNNSGYFQ